MPKKIKKIRAKNGKVTKKEAADGKITKKRKNFYFNKQHQASIVAFCSETDKDKKNKIYETEIKDAFEKLSENLVYFYSFHKQWDDVEALKNDCVINLYETMHKFDPTRGSAAFSYFNVVAKNWLIIQTRKRNKRKDRHVSIDHPEGAIIDSILLKNGQVQMPIESQMVKQESIQELRALIETVKSKLNKEQDIMVAEAVLHIFDNIDQLDYTNKRAIFVYIREYCGINPKTLSSSLSRMRNIYRQMKKNDGVSI
jgi:DNA-directed RNA polymerase specialized sigma24 family protein